MNNWLTSFFKRGSENQKKKTFSPAMDELFLSNTFEYPIPAVDPDYLLQRNQPLISELYRNTGLSEEEFDEIVVPVLINFARYVQVLPASEKHHHSGIGGLFRHSLEVFVVAVRLSNGKSFCGGLEGKLKAITKVRWPLAVGFAGFLHDAGKAVHDMKAVCAKTGDEWNPFNESLHDFACNRKYLPVWRESRTHKTHEIVGGALADQIIPAKVRGWLNMGDPLVLPTMLLAISGFEKPEMPVVYEIVKQADKESVSKHLSLPTRQDDGEESKRLPKYNNEVESVYSSQKKEINSSTSIYPSTVESSLSQNNYNEQKQKAAALTSSGVSSPASDEFLKVLPESLANKDLVVNQRDRERGIFWVSGGVAWVSWPQLFNAMKVVFEKYDFTSYPRSPGQFFDMFEMAGLVSKVDGEMSVSVRVSPVSGRSFKLNMASITSKDIISLIERYAEGAVTLEPESLGLNLEEESVMAIEPVKDSKESASYLCSESTGDPAQCNPVKVDRASAKSELKDIDDAKTKIDTSSFTKDDKPKTVEEKSISIPSSSISPKEYISKLDNNQLTTLRSTQDGEALEEIAASILTGRIPNSDWGLVDSCLYISWPKSASVLGEDADDILACLGSGRRLAKSSDSRNISIKGNGVSTLTVKGAPKKVLALSKAATTITIKAFELTSEFSIRGTFKSATPSSGEVVGNNKNSNVKNNRSEHVADTKNKISTTSGGDEESVISDSVKHVKKTQRLNYDSKTKISGSSSEEETLPNSAQIPTTDSAINKNSDFSADMNLDNAKKNEKIVHSENSLSNRKEKGKVVNDEAKINEVMNAVDRYLAKNHKTYKSRIKIDKAFIVVEGFAEIYLSVSKKHSQVEPQLLHKVLSSKHVHAKKQGKVFFFQRKLPTLKSVLNNK
jgi:hypothetical protein